MIICPRCKVENPDHSETCQDCGSALPVQRPRGIPAVVSLAEERSRHAVNAMQAEADARVKALGLTSPKAIMAHCAAKLKAPRPPGKWWARMILEDHAAGVRVHHKALEAAREVMESRVTASDEVE